MTEEYYLVWKYLSQNLPYVSHQSDYSKSDVSFHEPSFYLVCKYFYNSWCFLKYFYSPKIPPSPTPPPSTQKNKTKKLGMFEPNTSSYFYMKMVLHKCSKDATPEKKWLWANSCAKTTF